MALNGLPQFFYGQLIQGVPLPTTDMTDRTIIVTGANSGLGLEASKHLLRLNVSHLILACRSQSKGDAAKQQILASVPKHLKRDLNSVEVWPLDLNSYASVIAFAERCNSQLERLDGVVENAGISTTEYRRAEDNESTITVNVVSTFLLALLLLPKLRASAEKYNMTPHISIVGSAVHFWTPFNERKSPDGKIFEVLNDKKTAKMDQRYMLSKLLVVLCVKELAERITAAKVNAGRPLVVVNNVAPGYCSTELFREETGVGHKIALAVIGRSGEKGSRTLVHAVSGGKETHGQYLSESRVKR